MTDDNYEMAVGMNAIWDDLKVIKNYYSGDEQAFYDLVESLYLLAKASE